MEAMIFLLKAAAVLGIFYFTYQIFLRKETHFKALRVFLVSGVLTSMLLPFWYFTTTTVVEIPAIAQTPILSSTPVNSSTVISQPTSQAFIEWDQILMYVYIGVVLALSLRFFVQLTQLILLISKNPVRRRGQFRYVELSQPIPPFSFFNYICYNPQAHSQDDMEMILKHEEVHAFQWHSLDILMANIVVIAQWFNPFAWLYRKSITENLEFLADEGTVSEVPSKKAYQLALVKASSQPVPALATSFYQSFIKKRIIMLNKENSRKTNLLKAALILPLLAIFLYSFNIKEKTVYQEVEVPMSTPVKSAQKGENRTESAQTIAGKSKSSSSEAVTLASQPESTSNSAVAVTVDILDDQPELVVLSKDIRFSIDKNTTDAELKAMKAELKETHGVDLNYSVSRNGSGEITSISINYSKGNRNGSYNVSGDDPIDAFEFYMNEDGESGFWSQAREARRLERDAEREAMRAKRMKVRAERLSETRRDLDEEREELIIEREAMREEMAKRRKEMRDRMREERIIIREKERNEKRLEEAEIRYKIARGNNQTTVIEIDEDDDANIVIVKDRNGNIVTTDLKGHSSALIIDKDTSDQDLAAIKTKMAAKGIDFKYSKVKRNKSGELTRIKLDIDTNKGSKQSIIAKSDDGDPIDEVIIDLQ